MGYYSHAYGDFKINPPLSHAEVKVWRENFENKQWYWWTKIVTRTKHTPDGDLISDRISSISPPDDSFKAYDISEALQQIVSTFPDHEFVGSVELYGEDNTDIWRLTVVDGKVVEGRAKIIWGDGTEVKSRY